VLLEIYAERASKLEAALELAKQLSPIVLSRREEEMFWIVFLRSCRKLKLLCLTDKKRKGG
jgi:hypothetical protein